MEQIAKPPVSSPMERLRDYLRLLPPNSQSLLMREYEAALVRGTDVAVAQFVLAELRKVVRADDANDRARAPAPDIARLVFGVLDPFLVDGKDVRAGQIRRASLEPIWVWLSETALAAETGALRQKLAESGQGTPTLECLHDIRQWQAAASEAISAALAPIGQRDGARMSMPMVSGDLEALGHVLSQVDALETIRDRLPKIIRAFSDSQVSSIKGLFGQFPSLQKSPALAFAISLLMQRLTAPWQIIRLPIGMAGSDEEMRIAAVPHSVAVSMALFDLAKVVIELRADVKRGQFSSGAHSLKTLHDGLRDLRTELDLRSDSQWGRQLSVLRIDVSNALKAEIESIPGRVRRLLRQRTEKDINAGAKFDAIEIDETVALIEFLMICRTYAGELAINEVTLRAYSDLQHYVESATENLVESLRIGDNRVRAFRQIQTDIAIRFCEALFGHDYAALMTKAAEVAANGERKAANSR
jgi:hypothetical protein